MYIFFLYYIKRRFLVGLCELHFRIVEKLIEFHFDHDVLIRDAAAQNTNQFIFTILIWHRLFILLSPFHSYFIFQFRLLILIEIHSRWFLIEPIETQFCPISHHKLWHSHLYFIVFRSSHSIGQFHWMKIVIILWTIPRHAINWKMKLNYVFELFSILSPFFSIFQFWIERHHRLKCDILLLLLFKCLINFDFILGQQCLY